MFQFKLKPKGEGIEGW